jgi:hypothetical protein
MCQTIIIAYEKDSEFLAKVKKKLRLSGKAAALELIIKAFKKHLSVEELR